MTAHARNERIALCDLFDRVGAGAPTLCEGWTSHDLAAHLVVRENRLDAGPGLVLGGAAARHTDRVTAEVRRRRAFPQLVAQIRSGPPFGLRHAPALDERMNLHEFFVHHEDVRRANGEGPRPDVDQLQDALWHLLRRSARLLLRRVRGVGVELARPGGGFLTARSGDRAARITGEPAEIVLYLFGRRGAAEVELTGDATAVAALESSRLGT